ncbi:MAG: hypothetical protein UY60_C0002G0052 [Parcubacteria group bacterium GW2011_GWB1_50_9]|uniref:Glycosyltransferase 2-like domain-containing protein n=1 Tax=Candidatus Kaiserbacteria bacterium GW2011_GWC2_52_8b TaxID=1618676 RepID=A0A0G1XKL5_9BACT|nr:MAG: hypothetical protein UY60_C0002G0052 [Parcubacteria group bacterium GW2011_GWB1_50_9]KKW24973.1 MAG: hypothetical protein VE99_C0004G0010 [candidate division Kazan bacterium GW2011_GWC1_52_13]KKW31783.1 MAG: hypothetical protein UY74_C0007G0012 [Candidatus Kaiserbacteria bacterium GW2011_GWC2_52_8b]
MKPVKLSLIAPAHNEEDNIRPFVEKVLETFRKNSIEGEIIMVDDASNDRTRTLLHELKARTPNMQIIENRVRMGITGSIQQGYDVAQGTYIIFLPSDLQSDPGEDIPKLLEPLEQGYDIAAGFRQNRVEETVKIISSRIFNAVSRILFGVSFRDLGWIKGFRRDILDELGPLRSDWHRFFLILAAEKGFKILEVPTTVYPRKFGKSKFGKTGFGRAFGALLDIISIRLLLSFSRKPMFVFGSLGGISLFAGFAGGSYLIYLKIAQGSIGAHIPLLFFVVLSVISGIQFFMFGFIAEMIAGIKEKKK